MDGPSHINNEAADCVYVRAYVWFSMRDPLSLIREPRYACLRAFGGFV